MANPITWQNVTAPSNVEAMRGMEIARQSFNDGFGRLGSAVKEQQATNQGVIDRATFATEQDYLNALDGARSVDALTALRNSGALDQRFAALGATSQAKLRPAAEARLLGLQQQNDSAYARDRTRTRNTVIDALSAVNDPVELANAQAKAALQPGAAALAASVQQVATRQTADTLEDQKLSDTLAAEAAKHQVKQQASLKQLGAVAYGLKIPVDQFGAPDMANISKEQRALLDATALKLGAPTTEQVFAGDTKRGNAFIAEATKSGSFTPAALARNQASILSKFNSTGVGALMGNDKANVDNAAAQNEVYQKEKMASNWFSPGSSNAMKSYDDISLQVTNLYKDPKISDSEKEDEPYVQDFVLRMATTGINIGKDKEGKDIFVVPPAQETLGAIRSTEGNWAIDSMRASRAEDKLRKSLTTSRVSQLLKDAEESKIYERKQAVKALLNPVKADTKK